MCDPIDQFYSFPDYWVYFKAGSFMIGGRTDDPISRLLSLF